MIVPQCSSIDLEKDARKSVRDKKKKKTANRLRKAEGPQGGAGRALSDLWAGDPLGLVHYGTGMRKTPYVLYGHQHVAGALEDLHSLVVGNAAETVPIHLHDLISNLHPRSEKTWSEFNEAAQTVKKDYTCVPGVIFTITALRHFIVRITLLVT